MAKLKKVILQKVVVYGFKGYEKKHTFNLKEISKNVLIGDNAHGKSSFGESIVWAFTGKNIEGDTKDLKVMNNNSKVAFVEVTFIDETGTAHILQRKMASAITVKFDGKQLIQSELKEILDTDLFLAIFNPMYGALVDANIMKTIIFSLLPNITKQQVLDMLSEEEKQILANENFTESTTNAYLKALRSDLADISNQKKYLDGYMSKLTQPVPIPEEKIFDEAKLNQAEKILEDINSRKPKLIDLEALILKKSELDKKILEIKSRKFNSETQIVELNGKKALLEQELKTEMDKEYKLADVSGIETKLEVMRSNYKSTVTEHTNLEADKKKLDERKLDYKEGDTCPLCKQLISAHSVASMNAELQKEVSADKTVITEKQKEKKVTLSQLEKEGKELLAQITQAKKVDDEAKALFVKTKEEKITKLKSDISTIDTKLSDLRKLEEDFLAEIKKEIAPLEAEITALNLDKLKQDNADIQKTFDAEVLAEKTVAQETIKTLRADKEIIIKHTTERESQLKKLSDNSADMELKMKTYLEYETQEKEINAKINAVKDFNGQRAILVNAEVSKYLKDVSLKLKKVIESTGEIKDTFEILYCGKELSICSFSETAKAGMEISKMISSLSGCEFPVFVDFGESITSYEEPSFQTIEVRVVKDAGLTFLMDDGSVYDVLVEPAPTGRATKNKTSEDTNDAVA